MRIRKKEELRDALEAIMEYYFWLQTEAPREKGDEFSDAEGMAFRLVSDWIWKVGFSLGVSPEVVSEDFSVKQLGEVTIDEVGGVELSHAMILSIEKGHLVLEEPSFTQTVVVQGKRDGP